LAAPAAEPDLAAKPSDVPGRRSRFEEVGVQPGLVEPVADGLPDTVGGPVDRDIQIVIGILHDDPGVAEDVHDDPATLVLPALRPVPIGQVDGHPPEVFPELAEGEPQPQLDVLAYGRIDRWTLTRNIQPHDSASDVATGFDLSRTPELYTSGYNLDKSISGGLHLGKTDTRALAWTG